MKEKISVVGLGKLGACTAACFASGGYEVLGVDIHEETVNRINNSIAPVSEPGLQNLITNLSPGGMFSATTEHKRAIDETDITFIIVPTPSTSDGSFSNSFVKSALDQMAEYLIKTTKEYHLFVIVSTMMPGSTDRIAGGVALNASWSTGSASIDLEHGEKGNPVERLEKRFGIVYNPEFIALGSVIQNFLNPDFILIGGHKKEDIERVKDIYKHICTECFELRFAVMSPIEAEITKLALNTYITMKISFANLLSNVCEKYDGANVDNITEALGKDKRISPFYFKGGLSYGGPCFPRDTKAFETLLKSKKLSSELPEIIDKINKYQTDNLIKKITHKKAAILGLSYKVGTSIIEESPSIEIIERLLKKDCSLIVYDSDSEAIENTRTVFGSEIVYASSLRECLKFAELIIIAAPDEEFKDIMSFGYYDYCIIDCWRLLDESKFDWYNYIALGMGQQSSSERVKRHLALEKERKT